MTVLNLERAPRSAGPPRRVRPRDAEGKSRRHRRAVVAVAAAALVTLGSMLGETLHSGTKGNSGATEPVVRCLTVGATVNLPGHPDGPGLSLFRQADSRMGPLTMRRSFDRWLPTSFARSSAAGDAAAGLQSFVSWKPPRGDVRGATAGWYDQQIEAWAQSVPRTGVYATAFHEPENDLTAAEFVAFQRHVYTVVKAANPTILWGPVYMAYWWDPSKPDHYVGNPAAWWPGDRYADFVALDWYAPDPTPMTTSRSFTNWYRTMEPTGLPLLITEYGQYFLPTGQRPDPAKEQARASAIRQDADWIVRHPQVTAWLYWQGGDDTGEWRMRDRASQLAWQSVANRGCPS